MKKLIIANWKMNPDTPREARTLFVVVKRAASRLRHATVIVCPPAIFLPLLKKGKNLALGGQDAAVEPRGAFTGSIAAAQIKYAGAEYVILGHSERRQLGESDEVINKKVRLALKTGLRVILCLGETKRDEHGEYLKVLRAMLERNLERVTKNEIGRVMITYEPVWAITTTAGQVGREPARADTPEGFLEHALFIKKVLAGRYGQALALAVPVLYGGSVTLENAADFFTRGEAAGLLVGHESLRADRFNQILRLAENKKAV